MSTPPSTPLRSRHSSHHGQTQPPFRSPPPVQPSPLRLTSSRSALNLRRPELSVSHELEPIVDSSPAAPPPLAPATSIEGDDDDGDDPKTAKEDEEEAEEEGDVGLSSFLEAGTPTKIKATRGGRGGRGEKDGIRMLGMGMGKGKGVDKEEEEIGGEESRGGSSSPSFRNQQPPSFERSEFETIVRRLKTQIPGGLKRTKFPPVGSSLGEEEDNDWEFAGWGSVSYVPLPPPPSLEEDSLSAPPEPELLGVFRATSVAGNAVYGSVFYSMPAICSVSLSLSPLSMLIACLILLLWRGILVELGGAVRLNGGNYTYLLNVSGKAMSLLGAAVTLLDVVATGTVSAGTAAAYIEGEVTLPFKSYILGILILAAFAGLLLCGVKDSTRLTLSICLLHLATMTVLIICSFVAWGRNGSAILAANWATSLAQWDGGKGAARAVFNGICVGFLGVTGVECVPTFIQSINPLIYSSVIRNLLYGAILLNVPLLLLSFALLPSSLLLSSSNILSLLASACFPTGSTTTPWLRYLVVVDAAIVLCGGVLCGGVSCCGLLEGLARDGVLPRGISRRWERTGAEWISVGVYLGLCILFYATAGFSLTTISNVFSVSFMSVMLMFTVSSFLLHYNLPHLPISPPFTRTTLPLILSAFLLLFCMIIGNFLLSPILLLLLFLYLTAIFGALWTGQQWSKVMRFTIWTLDQTDWASGGGAMGRWVLPRVMFGGAGGGRRRGGGGGEGTVRSRLRDWMVRNMRRAKRDAVCAWVKDDEISSLIQIVLYVLANEQTSRLVLIHAYESVENIPSELQANAKLLDEAFPALTVDLKFVQGVFTPELVQSVADQLEIPPSFHLMGCPLPIHGELGGFGGVRVMRS